MNQKKTKLSKKVKLNLKKNIIKIKKNNNKITQDFAGKESVIASMISGNFKYYFNGINAIQ